MIRILLADDHTLFRHGLRKILEEHEQFIVIAEAASGLEAVERARECTPDIAVMDIGMKEMNGLEATAQMLRESPRMGVLILSMHSDERYISRAIKAGARGYMLKNSTAAQLVAGVRQIAFADNQEARGLSKIAPDLQALAASNNGYPRGSVLTSREQEVMRLLAEGRTVREVASELSLSVKTVEAHKLNLMRKLDIHNRTSLVEYAVQRGLVAPQVTH